MTTHVNPRDGGFEYDPPQSGPAGEESSLGVLAHSRPTAK